jgi:uncharacterized protein YunC (DUF1805 family)
MAEQAETLILALAALVVQVPLREMLALLLLAVEFKVPKAELLRILHHRRHQQLVEMVGLVQMRVIWAVAVVAVRVAGLTQVW